MFKEKFHIFNVLAQNREVEGCGAIKLVIYLVGSLPLFEKELETPRGVTARGIVDHWEVSCFFEIPLQILGIGVHAFKELEVIVDDHLIKASSIKAVLTSQVRSPLDEEV